MSIIQCRAPKNATEFSQYYHLRWKVLRAPWQQPQGSEKDELESQSVHRLIINDKNKVLAVGRLHFTDNNSAQIRYMAVDPFYEKQGLGKHIIEALEEVAVQHGIKAINLNSRDLALNFYQRLGYHGNQVSHILYDEIKHIAMKKQLDFYSQVQSEELINLVASWHDIIPLSKAMGVSATFYDQNKLVTTCDQHFNKNLHNTMFTCSIYTLTTLSGWSWIYLKLREKKLVGDIVLAEAKIEYLSPFEGITFAIIDVNNNSLEFLQLCRQRNEKVTLIVNVYSGEKIVAVFKAAYVIKPIKEKE